MEIFVTVDTSERYECTFGTTATLAGCVLMVLSKVFSSTGATGKGGDASVAGRLWWLHCLKGTIELN